MIDRKTNPGFVEGERRLSMLAPKNCPSTPEFEALPANLVQAVARPVMVRLCLDAVQTLNRRDARLHRSRAEELSPQMMLTLLSYCYATGTYGSLDVIWATENDPMVRYICGRAQPGWSAIRRFRRHHRDLLQLCLTHVFKQLWALKFDRGEADYLGYGWFESELSGQIDREVQDRIDIAVAMDSAEAD